MAFVFKILSGPLYGVEFALGTELYTVRVGGMSEESPPVAQGLAAAERILYLLAERPQTGFALCLDAVGAAEFELELFPSEPGASALRRSVGFNRRCQVGDVAFALKREGEPWSDEISNGGLAQGVDWKAELAVTAGPRPPSLRARPAWAWAGLLLLMLCAALLCVTAGVWWWKGAELRELGAIEQSLAGSHEPFVLVRDASGHYLVLARNEGDALWARQALSRRPLKEGGRVSTVEEERARLEGGLESLLLPFVTLRLDNPREPMLVLDRVRVTEGDARLRVASEYVLKAAPYARRVVLQWVDGGELPRLAENRLKQAGVVYRQQVSPEGVLLSAVFYQGDAKLAVFGREARAFVQAWGARYVRFAAELREDWLKDRSYKYGEDGYVKSLPSHWWFLTPDY